MSDQTLYDVLDFILNHADSRELGAVRAALRRREDPDTAGSRPGGSGPMGIDIRGLAEESAENMQRQIGISRDEIRGMVSDLAREVIRKQAPDLDGSQVDELLREWVPPEDAKTGSGDRSAAGGGAHAEADAGAANGLNPDHIRTMIGQFIAYSTGAMNVSEEMGLAEHIPDWQKRYWQRFSPVVRRLVSLLLNGSVRSDEFWRGIDDAIEPDGS